MYFDSYIKKHIFLFQFDQAKYDLLIPRAALMKYLKAL